MLRSTPRIGAAVAVVAAALVLGAAPALAHEQRQVGAYQFTVGWQHEPAYVDAQNAVQVFVHDAGGARRSTTWATRSP